MERIGKVLGNFHQGVATPGQRPKEVEPEPTWEGRREQLRKSLGLSSLDNRFDNFIPVKGTEKALGAFKALAEGLSKYRMLLCYGGVGNGKTHLCEATSIALYKQGIFCRVLTMARVMRALKGCIGPERITSYEELLHRYCYCGHLIIDDVGMGGSGSDWEWGQLEEIVVVRYRERLFTVMTTNLDITELPERISSRFRDPDAGIVVLNEGEDYRRRNSG